MSAQTSKWVFFELHEQSFGLEAERILEMVIADNIHESPLAPLMLED